MSAKASSLTQLIMLLMIMRISASRYSAWCSFANTTTIPTTKLDLSLSEICSNTSWNHNFTKLSDKSSYVNVSNLSDWYPYNVFVDSQDNIYVADASKNRVILFENNSMNGTTVVDFTSTDNNSILLYPTTLFFTNKTVFSTGSHSDRFGNSNCSKKILNSVTDNISLSFGLFVDDNSSVYVSEYLNHRVVKWINGCEHNFTVVAGGNKSGNDSGELSFPWGIHVAKNGTIYIADSNNRRIQKWTLSDKSSGTTLVGNSSNASCRCDLKFPTAITLDRDENTIFILDTRNNTIVRCAEQHQHCEIIVTFNFSMNSSVLGMSFDSKGNLIVADTFGQRILSYPINCDKTIPEQCVGPTTGSKCPAHNRPCFKNPCQNNGTCKSHNNSLGYNCSCSPGFNGNHCEHDNRPCQADTCFGNAVCNTISEKEFNCTCNDGRSGQRCEVKKDNCFNISCSQQGVCQSSSYNYTCRCFGDSFYGVDCELTSDEVLVYQMVSKSLAYIAIIAMSIVVTFVLILDALKYCFGIDPALEELQRIRQKARTKKQKSLTVQRFVYIHEPPQAFE